MKSKMLTVLGFVCLATASINFLGCLSYESILAKTVYEKIPIEQLREKINSVETNYQGYIVQAYIIKFDYDDFIIGGTKPIDRGLSWELPNGISIYDSSFEVKNPDIGKQLEPDRQYTIHVAVIKGTNSVGDIAYVPKIVKIDGLRTNEEVAATREEIKEIKRLADREEYWAIRNPDSLDISQYKKMSTSDFSFDMIAETLPIGSKVCFTSRFLTRPTGTRYLFENVNPLLTLTSRHNFVQRIRDDNFSILANAYFEPDIIIVMGNVMNMQPDVTVYVTVEKTGQLGECSIDILTWGTEP